MDGSARSGWCFGGGWSFNASLGAPVDATIVYYGRCDKSTEELAPLHGPVLGHFAEQDDWINQEMVDYFEIALLQVGKGYALHWYDAKHAFDNPTQAPRALRRRRQCRTRLGAQPRFAEERSRLRRVTRRADHDHDHDHDHDVRWRRGSSYLPRRTAR